MGKSLSFFTLEDAKAAFNLFCCVYGIGTLGMPGNFSRAGPALATVAMVFMAFANIFSSVVCCRVMLAAPKSVRTFSDLGEWCMGKPGRWLAVASQMGVCILGPCTLLVLGGTLLPDLFPSTFQDSTWIIIMAVTLLPVVLIPTLKEGAGVALAGSLCTLIADIIGIGVLLHGMSGHPSVPTPEISFKQTALTFGNLCIAYEAGIVIPAIQRQHRQPERMPRVVGVTLGFISILFITLASSGYSAVGCQISGNLLFTIYPDAVTGLTKLGFAANRGMVVLAFFAMQVHISIAFSIILHPALYLMERAIFGMHKRVENDLEAPSYAPAESPANDLQLKDRASKGSVVSMADIEKTHDNEEEESAEYKGHALKYIPMRILTVTVMTVVSIIFKEHFSDFLDFIGASCVALSCIILPILFYFKKLWKNIPMWEKIAGTIIVIVSFVLGCYVTYTAGKALFTPPKVLPTDPVFPFCHKEHQFEVYYNYTLAHHG